jgi:hypothetical protein
MARGTRLERLDAAVAADRNHSFDVPA